MSRLMSTQQKKGWEPLVKTIEIWTVLKISHLVERLEQNVFFNVNETFTITLNIKNYFGQFVYWQINLQNAVFLQNYFVFV